MHCPHTRVTAFIAVVLVVCITRFAAADDWESYQHDPQHTGLAGLGPDPTTLQLSWSAPAGFSSPLIVGNTVYSTSGHGAPSSVASFNLTTGQENWDTTGQYTPGSVEAYTNGMVAYIGVQQNPSYAAYVCVLNAATGAPEYTVPVPDGGTQITVATDTTTSQPVAYVASGNNVTAVRLGSTSGSVLWAASGGFSLSVPSVMGNYLLLESPLQYYAVNRTTGAVNHFYNGPGDGGGGTPPVVDLSRNQFYIDDKYGPTAAQTLSAYQMSASGAISLLWQDTGRGIGFGTVALGPDGTVYSVDSSNLVAINPSNGAILRSVAGDFAGGNAPMVSKGYVWEFNSDGYNKDSVVYRASDLSLVAEFPGTRGDLLTSYDGLGALDDTHLIIDYQSGSRGFDVYAGAAAPEPATASILFAVGCLSLIRRR